MAKTQKPASKGGKKIAAPNKVAKAAPAKKPMRRKSKRALNSALPHVDVTAPSSIAAEDVGKEVARLASEVMSAINIVAQDPKPTLWHRFRSAITGRWVKPLFAKLNPSTTVREKVRK